VVVLKIIQVEERFEITQCPQSSSGLGFGEDKFFRSFIPWRNRAGERLRTAKKETSVVHSPSLFKTRRLYLMPSPENGYALCPLSVQLPFSILKTESKDATTMNNVISTKCLPGQIRFPNPYAVANTGSSCKVPSGSRNRSGLKESGSGYLTGSCKIALQVVNDNAKGLGWYRTMRSLSQENLITQKGYQRREDKYQDNKPLGIKKPS
jgi:hypothetical protein